MRLQLILISSLFFTLHSTATQAQIYRYQDAQGRWQFTDKKPDDNKAAETVTLSQNHRPKDNLLIELRKTVKDDLADFEIDNPYLAPAQCFVKTPDGQKLDIRLAPQSREHVVSDIDSWTKKTDFKYWCLLGDPDTKPDDTIYMVPFSGYKSLEVSQGFNGRFSHFEEPQVHAIDIAMPVGTPITAARGGIVISTRDDYAYAGVSSPFFSDKANYVQILHEDGTMALYGHLLIGKILVEPGDNIETGDLIGYSGNTGFSTGPHLHFVIQYNNQGREKSVPFKLQQENGEILTPKRGQWLLPVKN